MEFRNKNFQDYKPIRINFRTRKGYKKSIKDLTHLN